MVMGEPRASFERFLEVLGELYESYTFDFAAAESGLEVETLQEVAEMICSGAVEGTPQARRAARDALVSPPSNMNFVKCASQERMKPKSKRRARPGRAKGTPPGAKQPKRASRGPGDRGPAEGPKGGRPTEGIHSPHP